MKQLRGIKPKLNQDREALTKAPAAPSYLSKYSRAEWSRIMPRLIEDRIITRADLGGIEELCICRGVIREIEEHRSNSGASIDPKLFGVQNRAMQTARQIAAEFGLSPTSRTRIGSAPREDDDTNPLNIK